MVLERSLTKQGSHLATPSDITDDSASDGRGNAVALAPVTRGERIESLDFIRGIAVMGILAANIIAFGQPHNAVLFPQSFQVPDGDPGNWMWLTQQLLIDGKMRGLFTVLFGAGLAIFAERIAEKPDGGMFVLYRRLFWLAIFGLLHYFLLWDGDILFMYAVCGVLALFFVHLPPTNQIILGAIGVSVAALYWSLVFAGEQAMAANDPIIQAASAQWMQELDAQRTRLMLDSTYIEFVTTMVRDDYFGPIDLVGSNFVESTGLILIGMGLCRLRFFHGEWMPDRLKLLGWAGLAAGLAMQLPLSLWVRSTGFDLYAVYLAEFGPSDFPRLIMTLALAALMVGYSDRWHGWIAQRVRAAGRAAFTNYIGTSFVMLFVFSGWALGLFGQLDRPQLYAIVLVAWVVMLAWSKPWLDHFKYGPLEWLWRCLTYGKLLPNRR